MERIELLPQNEGKQLFLLLSPDWVPDGDVISGAPLVAGRPVVVMNSGYASLGNIDGLDAALETLDRDVGEQQRVYENVAVYPSAASITDAGKVSIKSINCPVCLDKIRPKRPFVAFDDDPMVVDPLVHVDCVPEFRRGLQRVWDYSDKVLGTLL